MILYSDSIMNMRRPVNIQFKTRYPNCMSAFKNTVLHSSYP